MLSWLVYYLIFVAVVAVIIALAVMRLHLKSPLRLVILLFVLIISPVVLSFVVATYLQPVSETMVPDLIGKTLSEAQDVAQILDLEIKVEARAGSADFISNQRPEEGRIVKVGRTVFVILGERVPQADTFVSTFEGEVEQEPLLNIEDEPME
ncbi:MAG: PASTA domain-containing protein [Candidatus Saganbacteria bacterium]|nr:PASTA domain-containing protein [Candidatus Saganbacteria bacterium]